MKKIIKISSASFILILVSVFGLFYFSNKPKSSQNLKSVHIKKSSEVIYDKFGIPHIYANDESDAYFSLGFVMGRDRLWQMEVLRRAAAGRRRPSS